MPINLSLNPGLRCLGLLRKVTRLFQAPLLASAVIPLFTSPYFFAAELGTVSKPGKPATLNVRQASLQAATASTSRGAVPLADKAWRGVFFNPQVKRGESPEFPWLLHYSLCRHEVQAHLKDLVGTTRVNFVSVFVNIAHSLQKPSRLPQPGQPVASWANTAYLDNVAAFIDDCDEAGLSVEVDLASNLWLPLSVDAQHQIANSGSWPAPTENPWIESALWYRETIQAIEDRTRHPERIAMWCMMGNYEFGEAEPCLWDRDDNPAITASAEKFVKYAWPIFRSAGKRPKAPPILLPILSNSPYWLARSPKARLSAFANLKKWIVDDLALPPDYWVMTTYPYCDPAPDGFSYLKAIVDILGPANAGRIVSTDFKGPGHDQERRDSIIVCPAGQTDSDMVKWHFRKCADYGFAGWWIWAYQDTPSATTGIRDLTGNWKSDLVRAIKAAPDSGRDRPQ